MIHPQSTKNALPLVARWRKTAATLFVSASLTLAFLSFLNSAPDLAAQATASEQPVTVGFPEDNMANDWRAAQVRELRRALAPYPHIKLLTADAGGQVARNLQDIEDMVEAGAKLLFLGPRDARMMTPVVENLRARGIHIVLLTRRIESENFDTFVSPDDFKIARAAAVYLAEHLGGKGRVLMLEGVPTTTTAMRRSAGFRDGLSRFPGIRLITTIPGNYSRAGGILATEAALKAAAQYPENGFDAIFSHNDAMIVGARQALRAAGIQPGDVPAIGIDYIAEARKAIRKGEQLASFTYPTCGKEGARAALEILKGNSVPKYIEVPTQIVTRANVENVETVF